MLTVIVIIVMLVIAGGLVALYREVGLGRDPVAEPTGAPPSSPMGVPPSSPMGVPPSSPMGAPPSTSEWPLRGLTVGSRLAIPADEPFTGFLALCADDADALGELYSAAVVAEEWGYPLLVAIAKTFRPTGWTDRLDGLPGNIGQYDMRIDEMRSLNPLRLPVVAFLNEGRLLDASVALNSPSSIATSFQHCRFGLTR